MLRLALLAHEDVDLQPLIISSVSKLRELEVTILIPQSPLQISACVSGPFHYAKSLHDLPEEDPMQTWGKAVEFLWRISMKSGNSGSSWNELSSRILLWRSIVGEEGSEISEWARREVVNNL